jgi:hypothetical protein
MKQLADALEEVHILMQRNPLAARFRLFDAAKESGFLTTKPESLWEADKVRFITECVAKTEKIPGDIVELGSFKGGGAFHIAELLKRFQSKRKVHAVDSFEGLPAPGKEDYVENLSGYHYVEGMFNDASDVYLRYALELHGLTPFSRVVKGFFQDVVEDSFEGHGCFSMVIIDCDQYEGADYCLHSFYDRVSPGGIVVVDDYAGGFSPGITKAVDNFLTDKAETLMEGAQKMWFFVKQ